MAGIRTRIPFQPTFVANTTIRCSDLNQVRDGINYLSQMPMVFARQAIASSSMADVSWTTVSFDTIEEDNESGMSGSGAYIVQTSGYWYVTASISWPWGSPSTGARGTRITVNSVAQVGGSLMTSATSINHGGMLSRVIRLKVGDQVSIQGYQDTGKTINTSLLFASGRSETSYLTMNLMSADTVQV